MKSVIAYIRNLGFTPERVSDQTIQRAYWREVKKSGATSHTSFSIFQYLKVNRMIKD